MWCHRRWGDDKDNNVLDDDDDVETGGDGDAAHDEDDGYEDGNWTCDTKMVLMAIQKQKRHDT